MKLYSVTVTAHVDNLEDLNVELSAEISVSDPGLIGPVNSILPAHLRKVARDIEEAE